MRKFILYVAASLWFLVLLSGCKRQATLSPNRVVLYCSVDDVYARPIIKQLESETGLRIDTLYDTEATKTAGLATRIRAERDRPQGDVFWSSALLQTLLLGRGGLLQEYQSPSARDIPPTFKDARGAWTGLGVRPHLIVYHQSVKNPPRSLCDLLQPRFKDKVGISNPQFGTASDWAAALATQWGVNATLEYFRALRTNGVRVLPGNSVVADKVARGELLVGVTDYDDFLAQRRKSSGILAATKPNIPIWLPADTTLVPGAVAMLKGAPHPQAARQLMDALLAARTEQLLVRRMPGVLSPRERRDPRTRVDANPVTYMKRNSRHDTTRWVAAWDKVREPLAEILLTD
jgi:iron(III) transport system substrate-binding protein